MKIQCAGAGIADLNRRVNIRFGGGQPVVYPVKKDETLMENLLAVLV